MAKHHELKLNTEYFLDVFMGRKLFEVRKNDRDFKVGDLVTFVEFLPDSQEYAEGNQSFTRRIIYITNYEQKDGYVVFALEKLENER